MKSIRTFLIIISLSTICLVNFLSALNGYRSSMREADAILHQQLLEIAQLLEGVVQPDISRSNSTILDSHSEHVWFQIWHDGVLLARSPLAPASDVGLVFPGVHRLSYNGASWTALVHQREPTNEGDARKTVVVAQRADVYSVLIERMLLESILPVVWVLPLLGVLIWVIVRIGLRPLQRLADLLRNRRVDDFTPLDRQGYPQELEEVVLSTNSLLHGLSEAFEREKRFAADAAHELRTPLSSLKVHLHNLEKNHQTPTEDVQALLQSAERMSHSIEQLLSLYRLSPDDQGRLKQCIELDVLLREVVVDQYSSIEVRRQTVAVEAVSCHIFGDRFAVQTLMRNLLDNASKYTPEQGAIELSVVTKSINGVAGVEMVIEDSGPGIPESSYQRVFDRFYRLGGDRHTSKTLGSGLGLSIVDHIVRLHQGHIHLEKSMQLGGLKVKVWLPQSHVTSRAKVQ